MEKIPPRQIYKQNTQNANYEIDLIYRYLYEIETRISIMKDAEIHKARLEVFIRYIVDILRIEGIDNKTQELVWITTGDRC